MPRPTDVLFQGILLVVLVMVYTSYDFESFLPRALWMFSLWAVWLGYNELLRRIVTRRATRVESNCEELPEGLYAALSRQCLPDHMEMMCPIAGVYILAADYSPEWFSFLPASVSPHVWTVALLVLWLSFYFCIYRPILRQRVRNEYYRYMYQLMKKAAA